MVQRAYLYIALIGEGQLAFIQFPVIEQGGKQPAQRHRNIHLVEVGFKPGGQAHHLFIANVPPEAAGHIPGHEVGKLGKIQLLRGSHYQDMEIWPDYWMGLPPMWYGTHAIGPLVALSGSRVQWVNGFGSGTMRKELTVPYQNPFPVEVAVLGFENGLKGEATRSLFETARVYQEGLNVYGSKASLEWGFSDNDPLRLTKLSPNTDRRGLWTETEAVEPPAYYESLPESIQMGLFRCQ